MAFTLKTQTATALSFFWKPFTTMKKVVDCWVNTTLPVTRLI